MKLVCYAFKNKNSELEAPFLEYLEKYAIKKRDKKKVQDKKTKQIMNIKAHLEHLTQNRGKYNNPPITQAYRNRSIGIMKIKEADGLVRIAFYTKLGNDIVILDAMDKPKLYEKGQKQKTDRMIEKFLNRAEQYKQDYQKNNLSIPLNL